ncbi:MAG TPA: VWA domain-containing protein [Terriglobales bacterium]|nr:VWA domain-containing protein [Terriglobales bacterium]
MLTIGRRAVFVESFIYVPLFFVWFLATANLLHAQEIPAQKSPAPKASGQKKKLPKPRVLDDGVVWHRDPSTGELTSGPSSAGAINPAAAELPDHAIRVTSQIVPVTCGVFSADGSAIPDLKRSDFRIYEDGVEQHVDYFDVSTAPASVALVIDASPSVLRDSEEMKRAALALVEGLSPADQVAVVDFSAHTYLQTDFSKDRDLIRRGIDRVDVRQLLGDVGGSNIYSAVYLTTAKVFLGGREGRKAIVLLTDGQDSGLGLTLDPATAAPRPGLPNNRLTFEDVVRSLAAADIQIFAVSTESHPKVMTPEWFASQKDASLLVSDAAKSGVPAYTLYLAELVRRSGGQLYFLRDSASLSDIFRRIAQRISSEYTLGFYPAGDLSSRTGWHRLRVEVAGHPSATVVNRAAFYVPASSQ